MFVAPGQSYSANLNDLIVTPNSKKIITVHDHFKKGVKYKKYSRFTSDTEKNELDEEIPGRTIVAWDIKMPHEGGFFSKPRRFGGISGDVYSIAVTPNGKSIITGSQDKSIKVWDLKTHRLSNLFKMHKYSIKSIAISPDGNTVVSAAWEYPEIDYENLSDEDEEQLVKFEAPIIWDYKTGKIKHRLNGHKKQVLCITIAPNNKTVITGSEDKTLIVWDMQTGKELHRLKGHIGRVSSVAIFPDSKKAISGASDGTLRIWNLETGKELFTYYLDSAPTCCAITPQGKTVIVGDEIGRLHKLTVENFSE